MAGADDGTDLKAEELAETIRRIRERVRARHPEGAAGSAGVTLPDLLPLVHARDAAEAKVAAIGTVNPRPPGLANRLIQSVKRLVARALDWHVREQVEFNRAAIQCINAALESLNETNRALAQLAGLHDSLRQTADESLRKLAHTAQEALQGPLREQVEQLNDIRTHWAEWRQGWEEKLAANEIQFLRSAADLQSAFQLRVSQMESNFRDLVRSQHDDFTTALEKSGLEIQKRLWADLEQIRQEYERLIHNEVRVLRQRAAARAAEAEPPPPPPAPASTVPMDYLRFVDRFRGSEDYVRRNQQFYVEKFRGCEPVLDLGCGRGEFLELMKDAGFTARGIDSSEEFVAICRRKQLDAEQADLFEYLDSVPDASLGGIFCAQLVEHLPPDRVPELVRLAGAKLVRGGRLAIETPNPECLAIFASHFYLDPTHTRPVPASLMVFYLEEAGFGAIEVRQLSPAADSMPSLAALPEEFRKAFFGGLDYAILAKRL